MGDQPLIPPEAPPTWHRAASRAEVDAAGGAMRVKVAGRTLALIVWRGRVHAIDDRCPHRGAPLHTGIREHDGYIGCLDHGWEFNLVDGQGRSDWMGCVGRYDVEERDGDVWVLASVREPFLVRLSLPIADDETD
jgi:nitrite reductase/ring-hydroxylating ferredoxin subunit